MTPPLPFCNRSCLQLNAAVSVSRLVAASLLLVLVRGLSAAASEGWTDVYTDSLKTVFSGYYTGTAITASGGQTQMTTLSDGFQLVYYKYPEFADIPSAASPSEWDNFSLRVHGQKFFGNTGSPASESQWAPNLIAIGRPVSCIATATSTIGLVVREGSSFKSIGYDASKGPDIEFLPVVLSGSTYVPFGTLIQHNLSLGGQVAQTGPGGMVGVPWNGRLNLSPTPAVFAPNQGAAFGILYDPLTRLRIDATPSYITGEYGQTEVSRGTLPIRDDTGETYSPRLVLTGSLSAWGLNSNGYEGTRIHSDGSALGYWNHVKVLSNRLTISSTTMYSDQPDYDRDVSFVDGQIAWTSEEDFSHIIHTSNLSVSGTDTLVVASSSALGEALLTSDSRAAYEVWLSTESWAVQNGGFSGDGSIYLESPGGAKIRDGSILNEGLIRFRCPLATGSSTAFEPSRTLTVFSGAAILSGTQAYPGLIKAENGGFFNVRGEVTPARVEGFEGVAVTAGGLLSVPELVTGETRVSGNSDLIVGDAGLSSSDIRVTNGGSLSVSGSIWSGVVTVGGSASKVECEALISHVLALEDGSNFLLRPADNIKSVSISDGATLTTSGGGVDVETLEINGGALFLGGSLVANKSIYLGSGSLDAEGHGITSPAVFLGDSMGNAGSWSAANVGRITTSFLGIERGHVSLRGGVVNSLITSDASIDLWLDATSAVTADSAVTLTALDISRGGVLELNSFDGSFGQDRVGLRWTGGDHSTVLSEYLRDGRIAHRDGLGELRVAYDAESTSTLIVDPFAQKVFAVDASPGEGEVFLAPIKGNTAVLKTGPGSLTLSGSNSHYAGTTLAGGRLVAGASQAFGGGNVVVNGGTLDLASLLVSNDLSMVSGTLLNASQFVGFMDVSGVVVVSGTVGGSIFVDQQSELRGHDTTFTGMAVLAGVTSLTGSTSVEGGTLRIAHPLALAACSLVPLAGSTVDLSPDLHTIVGGLAPNAGGSIDVGNGMMTVAFGLSQLDLRTAITSGMGDGSWNGTSGITSSAFVHSLNERTIGWLDNGDGSLTFGYAASGDANLDWQVDILDVANFISSAKFNSGLSATWAEGDFNYDDFADILDIADFMSSGLFNAGPYNAPASTIAAVPEPSTCAMAIAGLACGGYSMFRRRKRA